jgi:hypothetical protein
MPKKVTKSNKPASKAIAKKTTPSKQGTKKRIKKAKPPIITDQQFNNWFFKLPQDRYIKLTEDWNNTNLKIKLSKQKDYDAWLNYFKALSPNQIRMLAKTGLDILPTEGYAALSRWHDIISNPGRIDKIHKAGLSRSGKKVESIQDLAAKNDRYGVLKAIRDELATKMQKGAGSRDTADLAKQLTEVMTQIADYERRLAPDKKTALGNLLSDMPEFGIKKKRPSSNGGGARNTSFRSRVTIKDVENN